jgi:hypothetical protein
MLDCKRIKTSQVYKQRNEVDFVLVISRGLCYSPNCYFWFFAVGVFSRVIKGLIFYSYFADQLIVQDFHQRT